MQKLSIARNASLNSFFAESAMNGGNWVRTKQVTLNGSALDITVNDFNGDVDKYAMIKISGKHSADGTLQVQVGGTSIDTTAANYSYVRQYKINDGAVAAANGINSYLNTSIIGYIPMNTVGVTGEVIIDLSSGKWRTAHSKGFTAGTGGSAQIVDGHWANSTTNINCIRAFVASGTFTGTIEFYKWQANKVSTLASYEVVKEYTLNNQTLNDTIAYDGELYPELFIISSISSATNIVAYMRLNGDTGSNYQYEMVYGVNATPDATYSLAYNEGLFLTDGATKSDYTFRCNLKANSGYRIGTAIGGRTASGSSDLYSDMLHSAWKNSTSPVTSLTIYTGGAVTGTIKVCRMVTTQLMNQLKNPIQLVLNKNYSSQAVSETIDLTDCEGVEIECSSQTNLANAVAVLCNNDSTGTLYNRDDLYNSGNSAAAYSGNNVGLCQIASLGNNNQLTKLTFDKQSKMFIKNVNQRATAGNHYIVQQSFEYLGTSPVTSLVISCSAGFSGKIKVYKKY